MRTKHSESRRDFIGDLSRCGALAVLGALTFFLGRKSVIDRSEHVCIGQGYCRGCGRQDACALPAALSARNSRFGKESIP